MMTKHKIRHLRKDKPLKRKNRGKYTMKEIIMKRVEHSYPCRLVQSAVKVTFPGMKKHVLVSFMGYKEPDLMHVMRCKGVCPGDSISPVACVPTKRRLKKVAMHLKAQVGCSWVKFFATYNLIPLSKLSMILLYMPTFSFLSILETKLQTNIVRLY